jgi:hypothetical protein
VECWIGGEPASAVCRFCGRSVCKAHAKEMPFIIVAYPASDRVEGLAVESVVWCGVCRPRPEPVALDFLEHGGEPGPPQ